MDPQSSDKDPDSAPRWGTWVVVFCCILTTLVAAFGSSNFWWVGRYDEGFSLTSALRLWGGELPHRDYWATYPPGTSLVLATFFAIFDPSLLVARAVDAGWKCLIVCAAYGLVADPSTPRRFSLDPLAAIAAVFVLLVTTTWIYPGYSVTPVLGISLVSLVLLRRAWRNSRRACAIMAGAVAGAAAMFRIDFCSYLFISVGVAWGLALWRWRKTGAGAIGAYLASFLVACAAVATFLIVALALLVGPAEMIRPAHRVSGDGDGEIPICSFARAHLARSTWLGGVGGGVACASIRPGAAGALSFRGGPTWAVRRFVVACSAVADHVRAGSATL